MDRTREAANASAYMKNPACASQSTDHSESAQARQAQSAGEVATRTGDAHRAGKTTTGSKIGASACAAHRRACSPGRGRLVPQPAPSGTRAAPIRQGQRMRPQLFRLCGGPSTCGGPRSNYVTLSQRHYSDTRYPRCSDRGRSRSLEHSHRSLLRPAPPGPAPTPRPLARSAAHRPRTPPTSLPSRSLSRHIRTTARMLSCYVGPQQSTNSKTLARRNPPQQTKHRGNSCAHAAAQSRPTQSAGAP